MRWPASNHHRYYWQSWFAWHPVNVHGTWVWLEWLERGVTDLGIATAIEYRVPTPPAHDGGNG